MTNTMNTPYWEMKMDQSTQVIQYFTKFVLEKENQSSNSYLQSLVDLIKDVLAKIPEDFEYFLLNFIQCYNIVQQLIARLMKMEYLIKSKIPKTLLYAVASGHTLINITVGAATQLERQRMSIQAPLNISFDASYLCHLD